MVFYDRQLKFSSITSQETFRFSILIFPLDDPLADFGQWEDFFCGVFIILLYGCDGMKE